MRKGAGSWVAKILLVLLVLSFGAWGVGDYLTASQRIPPVAKVGGQEITANDFSDALRREMATLQRRFGTGLSREQAQALGLDDSVLNRLIDERLYGLAATKIGVRVTDAIVRDDILRAQAFRGPTGQFDRLMFETFLRNEGYSEGMFVELLKRDIAREQYAGALFGAAAAPKPLVDAIVAYRLERRLVEYVRIEAAKQPAPPAPSEEQIARFHTDNPGLFSTPERRDILWVAVTPAMVAKDIPVSDAEMAEEYEAHKSAYVTPERRTVQQVVFTTEAEARAAAEAVRKGEDFAAMAERTRKLKPADIALGTLAREGLPPNLAVPVFALKTNEVTDPVQTAFGWHVARVTAIEPGSTKSLDQVKDELRTQLALQKAGDAITKFRQQADDQVAGGAGMEEIARLQKTTLGRAAAIDAAGKDASGRSAAGLPAAPDFLAKVFEMGENVEPAILDQPDGGFVVAQVAAIKPAALKPLAEVRPDVLAALEKQARSAASEARAKQIAERLRSGGDLAKEAQAANAGVQLSPPLLRSGAPADRNLSPAIVGQLFAAKVGETVAGPAAATGDWIAARVLRVEPADPKQAEAERPRLEQQLTAALQQDLLAQNRKRLEKEIGVTVNQGAKARAAF